MIGLIALADSNWGIGNDGNRLVTIPSDLKFFQKMIDLEVVIMGRKTYESNPKSLIPASCIKIILTRQENYSSRGCIIAHTPEEALKAAKKYTRKNVFVIGGEEAFNSMLPYCETAYITSVDYSYCADSHLANLDKSPDWTLSGKTEEQTYFDVAYCYKKYDNENALKI